MITIELKDFDDLLALAHQLIRDYSYKGVQPPAADPMDGAVVSGGVFADTSVTAPLSPQAVPAAVSPTPVTPAIQPQVQQVSPVAPAAPITPPGPVPAQNPPVPAVPLTSTQAAPVTQVQTSTPSYTLDDISRAATTLMDAGRQGELIGLLKQFGIATLPDLPKEQYGAFATALRGMGAQI